MQLSEKVIDQIKKHVKENNPGADNPYHNNDHIFGMAELAVGLYMVEDPTGRDADMVYLAGMFHDYGHSGGKTDDAKNIEVACSELFRWSQGMNLGSLVQRAIAAIRCTQFPFVREPACLAEKCLRDADIIWASYTKRPEVVMEGLRKEIEVSSGKPFTHEQMLSSQKSFLSNAKLFTGHGQRLMGAVGPVSLKLMEAYVESLNKELES